MVGVDWQGRNYFGAEALLRRHNYFLKSKLRLTEAGYPVQIFEFENPWVTFLSPDRDVGPSLLDRARVPAAVSRLLMSYNDEAPGSGLEPGGWR